MKLLFYLHHPAHFHLFRLTIKQLKEKGHSVNIIATKKDVLEELLKNENLEYKNFLPDGRNDNLFSIAFGLLKQDVQLFNYCRKNKPDLLIGTSTEICHVGWLLGIPNIFVNEDDADLIPLVKILAHPFAKHLLSPDVCNTKKPKKTISYKGYHELAYLHPDVFNPDKNVVRKYFNPDEPYFIIRFAKLGAHHDTNVEGLSTEAALKLIDLMKPHGKIYITSERKFEKEFESFRLNINPNHIHHVMAFAEMYIGDSQTMAAEAGVLGVPFIRYNDFAGRIGYLKDIEEKYKLGFSIRPKNEELLLKNASGILNDPDKKSIWKLRREKMLAEKINVTEYFVELLENYNVNL